jgi:excisionase family DNA binding protein
MKSQTHTPHRTLLRIPQAIEYVGGVITASTLRQWIWLRKIESIRIGRAVCIPADALDKIIEEGTMPAREERGA